MSIEGQGHFLTIYIFQILYVLCFTRPRYQVSVYRTIGPLVIVRQLQEKHLAANKSLYVAFIDLEKAFDHVPRDVIWWAMCKLGIDEWLVGLVQSMYKDVRSSVRVGTARSSMLEWVFIRALFLAPCSLSLC